MIRDHCQGNGLEWSNLDNSSATWQIQFNPQGETMKGSAILSHLNYEEMVVAKFLIRMLHIDQNDAQQCNTLLTIIERIGVE